MITAMQQEALANATQNASMANYGAIFAGFAEKGIADIQPRVNVFTFNAWKALGRSVKKGEHGVKVCTWVPMSKKDADGVSQPIGRKPRMTTVFHVSQTKAIDAPADSDSDADTGANAEVETRVEIQPEPQTAEAQGFTLGGFINSKPIFTPKPEPVQADDGYFSTEFTRSA